MSNLNCNILVSWMILIVNKNSMIIKFNTLKPFLTSLPLPLKISITISKKIKNSFCKTIVSLTKRSIDRSQHLSMERKQIARTIKVQAHRRKIPPQNRQNIQLRHKIKEGTHRIKVVSALMLMITHQICLLIFFDLEQNLHNYLSPLRSK